MWSRPPWARGLKHYFALSVLTPETVAPPVGAWIETLIQHDASLLDARRAPRGRVD